MAGGVVIAAEGCHSQKGAGRSANTERPSARCHGGAKMAILAYSLGKREINQYFTIKNAKLVSLVAIILLTVFHAVSRHYGGRYLARVNTKVLARSAPPRSVFILAVPVKH